MNAKNFKPHFEANPELQELFVSPNGQVWPTATDAADYNEKFSVVKRADAYAEAPKPAPKAPAPKAPAKDAVKEESTESQTAKK